MKEFKWTVLNVEKIKIVKQKNMCRSEWNVERKLEMEKKKEWGTEIETEGRKVDVWHAAEKLLDAR